MLFFKLLKFTVKIENHRFFFFRKNYNIRGINKYEVEIKSYSHYFWFTC
jgi:hypothetical protein